MGVQLVGRLTGVEGHRACFAGDLADSVAFGDARYADVRKLLTEQFAAKGIAAPELPDPPPFHADPPLELNLSGFGTVIFTPGSAPTTATGCSSRLLTPWASRSPTTVQARWSRACISAASTS